MIPTPPKDRQTAIARLGERIDSGELVAIDLSGARLITPRHPIPDDDRVCIVCGCALIGTQVEPCSGHWDYLRIEGIDPDQPYTAFLEALRTWLVERAAGLWVETLQIGYPVGKWVKCEVCGQGTSLVEHIGNDRGEVLKRHYVCADHRSFRDSKITKQSRSRARPATAP